MNRLPILMMATLIGAGCATTASVDSRDNPVQRVEAPSPVTPAAKPLCPGPQEVEVSPQGWVLLDFHCAAAYALELKKPLLAYVFTEWCGPCKQLDKQTFPSPLMLELLTGEVVGVKIDAGSRGMEAGKALGVDSYPTSIVFSGEGKEMERFFGFHPPAEYVAIVRDYARGLNTASAIKEKALAAPEDLALQFRAGKELAIRDRALEAIPFLEKVVEHRSLNNLRDRAQALYLLGRNIYMEQLKDYDKAGQALELLSADYPDTFFGQEAVYNLAAVKVKVGDKQGAVEFLKERVQLKPGDPMQYYRLGTFCHQYRIGLDYGIEKLEQGISRHPAADFLWKALAELRFFQEDYQGAIDAMEAALKLKPDSTAYRNVLETYRKIQGTRQGR